MSDIKKKYSARPGKTESKSESKSDSSKTIPTVRSDSDLSSDKTESGSHGYSRGEGQKTVTKNYRQGWDAIFGKKR